MNRILIKVGGEIVKSDQLSIVAGDIAALSKSGEQIVMVHGGGAQASAMQKQLGQEPNIVGGRRITDNETLDVMKMVVGGQINIDICSALMSNEASPIGLHGGSSAAVRAVKRPPRVVTGGGSEPVDFGYVGDVVGIHKDMLTLLLDNGFVPVLACLGADESGQIFNINADVVANQCAIHLSADHLILVTSTPGVLSDRHDLSTRIPTLSIEEARSEIAKGTIVDGMIPKIEESIEVLHNGQVKAVHIVGQLQPGDLNKMISMPGLNRHSAYSESFVNGCFSTTG